MTHETPEDKDFMAQHIKALQKEIETLTHRNEQLKDLIKSEQRLSEVLEKRGDEWKRRAIEYEDLLFAMGAMEQAPCFCCGYNGPNYYQPPHHKCADRHHRLHNREE